MTKFESHVGAIAGDIVNWLMTDSGASEPEREALQRGARRLAASQPTPRHLPARVLPVCAFWDQALSLVRGPRPERIAAALRALAPGLCWMQNPNYTEAAMGAHWLRHYGYIELIGDDGHLAEKGVRMGIMLLGPETLYPPHRHPAEEVYLVLGGTAEWQRGGEAWRTRLPGAVIHHAPGLVHATRTRDEPLLVAYLWWGAVEARAQVLAPQR
jgi:hypothetical protein